MMHTEHHEHLGHLLEEEQAIESGGGTVSCSS